HRSHGRSYLERSNPTGQRLASGYWQDEVMPAHAVIIGGGIAGLAAAPALQHRSWHVTILEREPAPTEVGAGITLWPNALRALDALGDRKSTRLNSSHVSISYAVFCLKNKNDISRYQKVINARRAVRKEY